MMDKTYDQHTSGKVDSDIEKLIEPSMAKGTESVAARFRKARKRYNIPLLLMMTVLVVFGLIVLYSVSGPDAYGLYQDSAFFLKRQLAFTIAGYVICLVISFFPVKFFETKVVTLAAAGGSLGLIILTMLFGENYNGAKRWITIGPIDFQSSEVVKVALILAFAGYCSARARMRARYARRKDGKKEKLLTQAFFDFILPVGAAILVDIFILAQPHVSCFIIVALIVFICTLSAGIPLRSWVIGGLILGLVGAVGIVMALLILPEEKMESIRRNYTHVFKRVEIYSEDESSTLTKDDTRQVDNAHNALGSGGMWGVGIGNSRSKYNYVSEAQNDYIFSIYVEETGFVGGLVLILMFLVFFVMCVTVVLKANTPYTRILSAGCTALIFVEFLLNLSVELQIIPSTGVTLPFFSYGGTAQVTLLAAMGFILCVSRSTLPQEQKEEEAIEEVIPEEAAPAAPKLSAAAAAPVQVRAQQTNIPATDRRPAPASARKKIKR